MLEEAFAFGKKVGVESCVGTETPLSHPIPPPPRCSVKTELGCLQDAEKRVFPTTITIKSESNTQEWCAGQCKLANHTVAAVEFGVACFCGEPSDVAAAQQLNRSKCAAMKCAGNSNEDCGGDYVMLSYNFTCANSNSTPTAPSTEDFYRGMFTRLSKRVPSLSWRVTHSFSLFHLVQ